MNAKPELTGGFLVRKQQLACVAAWAEGREVVDWSF
jgi:hypothetical protein